MKISQAIYIRSIMLFLIVCLLASCSANKQENRISDKKAKAEADSMLEEAYSLYDKGKLKESIEASYQVVERYKAIKDTLGMTETMSHISIAYQRLGNISGGTEMATKVLQLDSIMGDPELLSSDYNTLAALYLSDGNAEKAKDFILKAIEFEKQTPEKEKLSIRYGIASEVYSALGDGNTALDYAQKGYNAATEKKDTISIGKRLSQMGDALMSLKRYDEAKSKYLECDRILSNSHSLISIAINCKQLGNLYACTNNPKEAILYYERSATIARKIDYQIALQKDLTALAKLYAPTDPAKAYKLEAESHSLSDSIHSDKVADITSSFAAQFDLNDKEHTINEQARTIRYHRIALIAVALLLFLLIAILTVYYNMKRLRRKNDQLEARYNEKIVEHIQHKDVEISADDNDFLEHLSKFVEDNLGNTELSTSTLADEFCVSQRQFSRRVKQLTGIDTTHYIRAARILKARDLLKNTNMRISEIYVACGFESTNYFSRIFRQDVGVSPTEYRKSAE